ncbi:Crp/Fnr family transcriptional regulator [Methylorubrum populi]|uniref:Crp/Fnr family transcriptional regulator n=1 Tax=Methylobacterium radiotolerans TaxID=31998 RepID=A0ABU7T656_9HYPH
METMVPVIEVTSEPPELARVPRHPAPEESGAGCALARKLDGFGPLTEPDRTALEQLRGYVRLVERHVVLVDQDRVADHALIVFSGFAARHKRRTSGRRQILAYLIPGDLCDRGALHGYPLAHAIETLTLCRIARIPRATYLDLLEHHPGIAVALQRARLAEEATAREWIANIGIRSGVERAAHLLCELLERLKSIGQASDGQFELPLTQVDLAEALGLSSVYMNRVLQALRRDGLIASQGRHLRILAPRRLRQLAEFEAGYL